MPSPAGRHHPRKEAQAVGLVGPGKPGPRREFLRISHMRRGASDSPEGKTQRLERSCLRRSLRLWHRRVALRAVGLEGREEGRKKSHSLKFWRALKYQRAAHSVGYRDPGSEALTANHSVSARRPLQSIWVRTCKGRTVAKNPESLTPEFAKSI